MAHYNSFKHASKKILIIFAACIGIGFLIYFYVANTLIHAIEESITETVNLGARIVGNDIRRHLRPLETISKMAFITDPNLSFKEKARHLDVFLAKEGFIRLALADLQGNAWTSDGKTLNIGDLDYFRKAALGQKIVSGPIADELGRQTIMVFSVPIFHGGQVSGLLHAVSNVEELSITDKFRKGNDGNALIIGRFGKVIAPNDRKLAVRRGTDMFLGFAPIAGTDWFLAIAAPKSKVFKSVYQLLGFLIGSILIICAIVLALNMYLQYLRRKLLKERRKSSNVIQIAEIIVIKYDRIGKILDFNRFAEEKTGFKKKEIINKKNISELLIGQDQEQTAVLMERLTHGRCPSFIEAEIKTKTGGKLFFIGHCRASKPNRWGRIEYELMGTDITERVESESQLRMSHQQLAALNEELITFDEELRLNLVELLKSQKQLRESEERHSLVVEASGIGIWDWDAETGRYFVSFEWCKILGITPGPAEENFIESFNRIHPEDLEYVQKSWDEYHRKKGGHFECQYRIVLPSGEIRWVQAMAKAVWNMDGKVIRMAGSYSDVTRLKEYQERLEFLAYHDPLTKLPNRLMLRLYWTEILDNNQAVKSALFFIDSDNFKFINDTLGHNHGDQLIVAIGSRLKANIGENDNVFRIGGDEFVVSIPNFTNIEDIETVAKKIIYSFAEPFEIANNSIHITVSLGIAIYPDHGVETDELLKNADIAMYKAKECGKNRFVFYDAKIHARIEERMWLEKNLGNALSKQEFLLHYQPQVDLKTGTITGFEALLRWNNLELGLISPLKFIEITEDNGLIIPLGEWVLNRACRFMKDLQELTGEKLAVSVNASIIQLMQDDFVERVLEVLKDCRFNPELLELEITESVLIESFETIYQKLESLREKRVRIALDDFGKGYSSLNYLCRLPISTLKIDKSFVDNIINKDKDRIIIGDIVAIGHKVGLSVIAEGVETDEQLQYLMDHECDKVQGFIYSKPLPEEEVIELLRSKNKLRHY